MAKPLNASLPGKLTLALLCGGCAQDYSLAPPASSEQVTVRIKVPPELQAGKVEVMYRSSTSQRTRYGAYGELSVLALI